LEGGKDYPLC